VGTGGYDRNMLSALLTTLLVHRKQRSLNSHKAKTREAKLRPVSWNMELKLIRKASTLSIVSETLLAGRQGRS
jgi:hypothetical protein